MSDDHPALMDAVLSRPGEDTPRLVLADWLDDNGAGDRAEFIRVQIELARYGNKCDGPCGQTLCRRCHALQKESALACSPHIEAAFAPSLPDGWYWTTGSMPIRDGIPHAIVSRGFVDEIRLSLAAFAGATCEPCEGRGTIRVPGGHGDTDTVLCPACNPNEWDRMMGHRHPDAGTTPGLAAELFKRHPITAVRLTDVEPFALYDGSYTWALDGASPLGVACPVETPTAFYSTRDLALAALSSAAVSWGRALAGLPALA